jgi:hypothetical protein
VLGEAGPEASEAAPKPVEPGEPGPEAGEIGPDAEEARPLLGVLERQWDCGDAEPSGDEAPARSSLLLSEEELSEPESDIVIKLVQPGKRVTVN